MMTKIQPWQISSLPSTESAHKVSWQIDLQKSIIHDTIWVDTHSDPKMVTWNAWKRYRHQVQTFGFVDWGSTPDVELNQLYTYKASALELLYTAVYQTLTYLVGDPMQNVIYAEKATQAVRFLSTPKYLSGEYPVPTILLSGQLDKSDLTLVEIEQIAKDIVAARTDWIAKIQLIEDIRILGKKGVLKATKVAQVTDVMRESLAILKDKQKQWIST